MECLSDNKEFSTLKDRLLTLRSKAEKDQQTIQANLISIKRIQTELSELSERIGQLQTDFQSNVQNINEIGNSEIRLKRFENIIERVKAEENPLKTVEEELGTIRSCLLPTQFDHASAMLTEQKSRMADLLARSENRHAHLQDVIKVRITINYFCRISIHSNFFVPEDSKTC